MNVRLPEDIFKIEIQFMDGAPDGPRLIQNANWNCDCIVCPRVSVEDVQDHFKVSGVYILYGPEGTSINGKRVYVGQGDVVIKRLKNHLQDKDKEFWNTAIVFARTTPALHAGQIKYLEARLIELANNSGRVTANQTGSNYATLSTADKAEMEKFLATIIFSLIALGYDFFRPLPTAQEQEGELDPVLPVGSVPSYLQKIKEQLDEIFGGFPDVEAYTTQTDYRAKVTIAKRFRVFARLKYRKNGAKLELKDVRNLKVNQDDELGAEVTRETQEAYKVARAKLEQKMGIAAE